jgi:hypothetical protein
LTELVSAEATPVRCRRRARLLLDTDITHAAAADDRSIARLRGVSVPTVARVRQLFAVGGVEAVLAAAAASHRRPTGVTAQQAARLYALADSPPPAGSQRWSLRLLAETMVVKAYIGAISHETVRRVLRERAPDQRQAGDAGQAETPTDRVPPSTRCW